MQPKPLMLFQIYYEAQELLDVLLWAGFHFISF